MSSKVHTYPVDQNAELRSASAGFDHLFANRMEYAKAIFKDEEHMESPFHLMGLGVCSFLEAALGMETEQMAEATRCLSLCEVNAKKHAKAAKDAESSSSSWLPYSKKSSAASHHTNNRLPAGIEWEILQADAIVCQALTHALSESYMGYLQCMYMFNSAHSKFTKLYKSVFPHGIDPYITPSLDSFDSALPSSNPSIPSLTLNVGGSVAPSISSSAVSVKSSASGESSHTAAGGSTLAITENRMAGLTLTAPPSPSSSKSGGFFGRLTRSAAPSPSASKSEFLEAKKVDVDVAAHTESLVEELVVSGAAFGFGLFNLAFSLLPARVKSLVGFFGFQHDRKLALQALSVSAARSDIHAVFSGLTLMSYFGFILNFSGFQADEAHMIEQYRAIVDKLSRKYPGGSLWMLNRAKIFRITNDPDGAIAVLQESLSPERPEKGHFRQADAVLVFELAWTLVSQRRYKEAAEAFSRMTKLNNWSHATYCYLAGGCLLALNGEEESVRKGREYLDKVPSLLDKRKVGGRELPMEVYIKNKIAFYKGKQKQRGGKEDAWYESATICLVDEIGVFWNMFARIRRDIAISQVEELCNMAPLISDAAVPASASKREEAAELNTQEEIAVRALLLGLLHRSLHDYTRSRSFFEEVIRLHAVRGKEELGDGSKWVGGFAFFESAVGELRELQDREASLTAESSVSKDEWRSALKRAEEKLEKAASAAGNSERLDSRVNMLRSEIALKRELVGSP